MGSSASTHANVASSASSDSNIIKKGSQGGKQQCGVSGHTNGLRSDRKTTTDSPIDLDKLSVSSSAHQIATKKEGLERRFVLIDNLEESMDQTPTTGFMVLDETASLTGDEHSDDMESESDDEEDDYDEVFQQVLDDARKLKVLARDYMHPERSVETTDPMAFGRNFFSRPSAVPVETQEEAEELDKILQDAKDLAQLAKHYAHPEESVKQTEEERMFASARNYFDRVDGPVQESWEHAEERAKVLEDAQRLKKLAVDYLHPEKGVTNVDSCLYGRNYFNRPSAIETEEDEFADERAEILEEMTQMKKLAVEYMHPEVGVKTSDATVFGRNYFNRPSAHETEDVEFASERAQIITETKELKKLAMDYMHPEKRLKATDATVFGRDYFNRPSALETEDVDFANERMRVLEESLQLKKLAMDYSHPEVGVKSFDGRSSGRNYFNRPSAFETEDVDFANERMRVLEESLQLKKLATDYSHPEVGVKSSDGRSSGRNYFNRPSALETEDVDFANERVRVLEESLQLKKLAMDYSHPEVGVKSEVDFANERVSVLEESLQLKELATDYSHPEVGVKSDIDFANEYVRILEESLQLKNLATDYSHPEVGVKSEVDFANERVSVLEESLQLKELATDYSHHERVRLLEESLQLKKLATDYSHHERVRVLEESLQLKKPATDYSHPEVGFKSDVDFANERVSVLEESLQLKKLATDYSYPEVGVISDADFDNERVRILEESLQLKKLATDYSHPEVGDKSDVDFANERVSVLEESLQLKKLATDYSHHERVRVLEESLQLKKLATDYSHPEVGVKSDVDFANERVSVLEESLQLKELATDYSHPEGGVISDVDFANERVRILEESLQLKKLATDYSHPEVGVKSDVNSANERVRVLEESLQLKKLATDYNHREVGAKSSDGTMSGRNYFNRPSALETEDAEFANERVRVLEEMLQLRKWDPKPPTGIYVESPNDTDNDETSSTDESDHMFEFEEEYDFTEVRETFINFVPSQPRPESKMKMIELVEEDEEGNLSRSPSSVMLFGL